MGSSTLTSPTTKSKTPVLLEDGSYRPFWFDERIWASVLLIVFGGLYYGMPYQWNWKNHQTERKDDPFGCANLFFSVVMTLFGVIVGFFGCTPILRQYSVNENVYPFSKNLSKNFISLLNITQGVVYIAAVIFGLIAWVFSYVSQFYLINRNAEGPWLIAKSVFLGPAVCLLVVSAIRQFGSIESRDVAAQATLYNENTTATSSIRTFFADPRFYWLLLSIMYPIAPLVETADWLNSAIEAKNIVFWFFTGLGLLCVIPMIYFIFAPSHRTREHISTPTTDPSSPPVKHSYLSPVNGNITFNTFQFVLIGTNIVSNLIACAMLYDIAIIDDYSDGAGEAIWFIFYVPFFLAAGLLTAIFSISDQLNTILISTFITKTSDHHNDIESQ
jgi:hypothetical protein